MFLWVFFFLSLFLTIDQAIYCKTQKRNWRAHDRQLVLGALCAVITGLCCWFLENGDLLLTEMVLTVALLCIAQLLTIRFCYDCPLERLLFGKRVRRLLALSEAQKQGRLQKLPCKQGQRVFWVDLQSKPARIHSMRFVTQYQGRYIGSYEEASCLVLVDHIYFTEQEATAVLHSFQWNLYSGN